MLSGPIATVDGVDVSHQGALFSLLPGCHVVVLQSQIGEGGVSGAWSVDIPRHVYAFRMTAGNSYVVNVRLLPGNHAVGTANVGGVKLTAVEQDSQGKQIGKIEPARGEEDIAACQAWAAGKYGQPEAAPSPEEPAPEADDGDRPVEPAAGDPPAPPEMNPDAGAADSREPAAGT